MTEETTIHNNTNNYNLPVRQVAVNKATYSVRIVLAFIVAILILIILGTTGYLQKKTVISNAEAAADQMSEHLADDIGRMINYASSSIKSVSSSLTQTMTSDTLSNPAESILPLVENTPFAAIEYIRADGMNVMNIGEPFDASDRVYYIEGIKGNSGIWNNYHPKTSKDNLMNFYTPLMYEGKVSGVITGYIQAASQIVPMLETDFYGKEVYSLLLDENNMVIATTIESEYVKDLTLEMYLDRFEATEEQKSKMHSLLEKEVEGAVAYKDPKGEGRIAVTTIPNTGWRVAVIVPPHSFAAIVNDMTVKSIFALVLICVLLVSFAAYILLSNIKRRKEIAAENEKLEEENRIFNEENRRAFAEISEIRDIITSANMGTWRIELTNDDEPRMYVDDKMRELLGISQKGQTPEEIYQAWFSNIEPEAVSSVIKSVERMENGFFDENTYRWIHPAKGVRYVRCGGTCEKIEGGFSLRGYHYDVDEVVRTEQAQMRLLKEALDDKNEYYATLGALGDIFYSMHVIDLKEDRVDIFNGKNEVREIVNHRDGAIEMMNEAISATITDECMEDAQEFTNLATLSERMKDKIIITKEMLGKHIGWIVASFIAMDRDEEGKPVKVIFTTRIIDEEKKQKEKLIFKSQTDELTGLLNRRAYEEDIYAHNDTPDEDNFIYVSLDVNGLKIVNDTLGHTAGDELIIGACKCMKQCLGPYGRLYRTGGDEFVAILHCNSEETVRIMKDFDETLDGWKGELIDSVSVSYGWINKNEMPEATTRQLGAEAEKRMYEAKSAHYRKKGVDRRGQQDAHKTLCELYTKILKINISDDTYQIVNMDVSEQTEEKGFSDRISQWLSSFGKSGQVHPDDLEEYLKLTDLQYIRNYFAEEKTSLHIFYRRKTGDDFKQVMMEMVPANDYAEDNMSLFLYVKNIDK